MPPELQLGFNYPGDSLGNSVDANMIGSSEYKQYPW